MSNKKFNLKCALLCINFVVGVTGLLWFGLGTYQYTTKGNDGLIDMALGGFIILVELIGFIGWCKENVCLLVTYSLFSSLLMFCNVAVVYIIFFVAMPNMNLYLEALIPIANTALLDRPRTIILILGYSAVGVSLVEMFTSARSGVVTTTKLE